MPKLKNVTAEELKAIDDTAFDLSQTMRDCADRIEKGYCDNIGKPFDLARSLLSLSRSASDLCAQMMSKHGLAVMQAETEALIRSRMKE